MSFFYAFLAFSFVENGHHSADESEKKALNVFCDFVSCPSRTLYASLAHPLWESLAHPLFASFVHPLFASLAIRLRFLRIALLCLQFTKKSKRIKKRKKKSHSQCVEIKNWLEIRQAGGIHFNMSTKRGRLAIHTALVSSLIKTRLSIGTGTFRF